MILTGWYPIVDVVGAMFCPTALSARRNSTVTSRSSAQARSASDRSVISAWPDNWRLMSDRRVSSRRASSCWVKPPLFSSMIALSNSRRTRPMNLPAIRDRVSMSNRKNVIRRNPLYAQCRIDPQFAAQPADGDAIAPVEIMVLDRVSPISKHGNKTVLGHEPSEDTDIRRLQFPDGVLFRPDDAELLCKDELLPAQERIEQIVDLFRDRGVSELPRGLCAIKNVPQPGNELRRAVKQPKRLIAWREIDVDLHDRSTVHEIGDGRHGAQRSTFPKIAQSGRGQSYAIPLRLLHNKHAPIPSGRSPPGVGPLSQRGKDRPIVSRKVAAPAALS